MATAGNDGDVTFIFDGSDAGLAQAATRAVGHLDRVGDAYDAMGRSARRADGDVRKLGSDIDDLDVGKPEAEIRKFTLSTEKMGQAVSLVSPRLGELTAKIGGLGAAGGPVVLATAAAVALGAAYVGIGVSAIEAVRDIDTLTEALTDQQREALAPQIEAVRELNATFDEIGQALTEGKIRLLGAFADEIDEIAEAVLGLVDAFNKLDESSEGRLSKFIVDLFLSGGNVGVAAAGQLGRSPADRRAREAAAEQAEMDRVMAGFGGTTTSVGTPDSPNATTGRARSPASSNRETLPDWQAEFGEFVKFTNDVEAELADLSVQYVDVWIGPQIDAALQHAKDMSKELRDAEIADIEAVEAARKAAARSNVELAIATTGALIGMITEQAAAQADSEEEQWRINHLGALAQAAISVPLAILTGLEQGGPVLAAVNGALAAIQLGIIAAAQPPKFHTGGMAPDEVGFGGLTMRAGERMAVLTAEGQRSLDADDIARANAGVNREPEWPVSPTFVVDGLVQRGRVFGTNPRTAIGRR